MQRNGANENGTNRERNKNCRTPVIGFALVTLFRCLGSHPHVRFLMEPLQIAMKSYYASSNFSPRTKSAVCNGLMRNIG